MPNYYNLVSFDVRSTDVNRVLTSAIAAVRNLKPAMKLISRHMYNSVMENFRVKGRPSWPQLKQSTIERKRRAGSTRPNMPLYRTGEMKHAIYHRHTLNMARVTSPVGYGIFHHMGTKHHPRRRFMMFQLKDVEYCKETIELHIAAAVLSRHIKEGGT